MESRGGNEGMDYMHRMRGDIAKSRKISAMGKGSQNERESHLGSAAATVSVNPYAK